MSNPQELSVEEFVQAVMVQNAPIGSIPADRIFVQSGETTALANKDRIVCASRPREPALLSYDGAKVKQYWVPLDLTLYTGPDFTEDQIQAALDAMIVALDSTTYAMLSADALAALNAGGILRWESTPEGQFDTQDNGRKRTKLLNYLCTNNGH